NSARAGDAEKSFEMARVIPHHGSDAVSGFEAEFCEGGSEPSSAAIKIAVRGADDGAVRSAGNDFHAREKLRVALQNVRERERKVHHRSTHKRLGGQKLSEWYHRG